MTLWSCVALRALVLASWMSASVALAADRKEDILEEYSRFYTPVEIASWDKSGPNVVEFFSFNCNYCYEAEKSARYFKEHKPTDVSFKGFVVASGDMGWQLSQYAYAAAELAGLGDEIHDDLFKYFHVEKKLFNTKEDVRAFFEERGLLERVLPFLESKESKALRMGIYQKAIDYGIPRVPTFIVNGKYVVAWGTDQTAEKLSALLVALARQSSQPPTVNAAKTSAETCAISMDSCEKPIENSGL